MVPAVLCQWRYHRPVRKLIKIALVALATRTLWRWWKRRGAAAELDAASPTHSDPAVDLREKLAESRGDDPADEAPVTPEASVENRRADVHEQGRAALDEMKPADES